MATRAEDLASQLDAATQEAIETVQNCSDERWHTPVPNDGRSVGVLCHHMATGDLPIGQLVEAIAYGRPMPPITAEVINQGNARHAQQFANVGKADTVALLQQNGSSASAVVRALSDEQLDRSADFLGQQWTAERAIRDILIGHVTGHLQDVRAVG